MNITLGHAPPSGIYTHPRGFPSRLSPFAYHLEPWVGGGGCTTATFFAPELHPFYRSFLGPSNVIPSTSLDFFLVSPHDRFFLVLCFILQVKLHPLCVAGCPFGFSAYPASGVPSANTPGRRILPRPASRTLSLSWCRAFFKPQGHCGLAT